jgi:hypothetical protein
LKSKPILLSDSKGSFIHSNCRNYFNKGLNFELIYRGGDQYHWLTRNLKSRVELYGLITLGTCDLTCGDSGSKIIGF